MVTHSGQLLIMVSSFYSHFEFTKLKYLVDKVEKAVEENTVYRSDLLRIAVGCVASTMALQLFSDMTRFVFKHLNVKGGRYYTLRTFRTLASLDYPTFGEKTPWTNYLLLQLLK